MTAWVLLACTLAACSSLGGARPSTATPHPQLAIDNRTTLNITLVVNGDVVGTVGPSTRMDPVPVPLPPLPWNVEARSPTDRLLLALTISSGDVVEVTGSGVSGAHGKLASVDLSCGRLLLWTGPAPVGEPTFIPGPTGDCK